MPPLHANRFQYAVPVTTVHQDRCYPKAGLRGMIFRYLYDTTTLTRGGIEEQMAKLIRDIPTPPSVQLIFPPITSRELILAVLNSNLAVHVQPEPIW